MEIIGLPPSKARVELNTKTHGRTSYQGSRYASIEFEYPFVRRFSAVVMYGSSIESRPIVCNST